MSEKRYFSYVRVSTVRQGQSGTSLHEQRSAIERYAGGHGLKISKEFEEQETAAKQGRPVFLRMIRELKRNRAAGVVMHKIDRSARNLKDWAELGELIDRGIEVHFANENLDLYSIGGRLSADIQAVIAANYIRNLREEVRKGFYGRLKQGYYPMPAPIGYLDRGAGVAKEHDPQRAPLVRKAFELYATGNYGVRRLAARMRALGLTNRKGRPISTNTLNDLLHNPFYFGCIRIKTNNELYPGKHLPIISRSLFEKVNGVFEGRLVCRPHEKSGLKEAFLFRKRVRCGRCGGCLIVERQKGHLYYRCRARDCPQKTIREELIEGAFLRFLKGLEFDEAEKRLTEDWFTNHHKTELAEAERTKRELSLRLERTQARLSNLTDALVEGLIEKEIFVQKKNSLVLAAGELETKLVSADAGDAEALRRTREFVKMANSAHLSYRDASFERKRELMEIVAANFSVRGKSVEIKPNLPFELLLNRGGVRDGGPHRSQVRTLSSFLNRVWKFFVENGEAHEVESSRDLGLEP